MLEERLGVKFKDRTLLIRGLTHRSAAQENALSSNERLEFLGDSVVGLVVCENLLKLYPLYSEGDLAKSKAYIVSEMALFEAAKDLGLEEFVQMSEGEISTGGRRKRSILADTFEALIAAIYLDCGLEAAAEVVCRTLSDAILSVASDQHRRDYKTSFQERAQAQARKTPSYRIIKEEGHEHDKTFVAQALVGDLVIGQGSGKSKKEAEQSAAKDSLENLPIYFPESVSTSQSKPESG